MTVLLQSFLRMFSSGAPASGIATAVTLQTCATAHPWYTPAHPIWLAETIKGATPVASSIECTFTEWSQVYFRAAQVNVL